MRKTLSTLTCILATSAVLAGTAIVEVDASKPTRKVNPNLYGIFLEEINHGVDGGLYAELIRNRAFEDSRPPEGYVFSNGQWRDERGFNSGFSRYGYTTNGIPFWSMVKSGSADGSMHLETTGGISEASAYCLRLDVANAADGQIGVANEGFLGIGVKEGAAYNLSLHARCADGFNGPLTIRLEDSEGAPCSDEVRINGIGSRWSQFKGTLNGTKTISKARLVITAGSKGKVWLDFVSLFPKDTWKNRPNGLRSDLAQLIADLKPKFVRFPGGCVVDAGTIETAYDWKLTVGPLEQRAERWGPWNYRRTQGMGLFEYFQFCDDLGAEPLWVGFAGQTCIHRQREHVPMSEMGWVRDNFLDIVEYANGPADSGWGRLRAEAGRREPFNLKYVEIGNENQGREYGERYRFIHSAMKAKHPNLIYLADLSWTSRESMGDAHFDIEDQHYYNSPAWFSSRFKEYDKRDRALPPLYLGEVAVTTQDAGPTRGNLRAALAEGVFLMGCERNADVVSMVSYAPLLGHVEGRTELTDAPPPWHAMIYFDGIRSFGTVSYYLWKLFGENVPAETFHTEVTIPSDTDFKIAGQIGVGTWNTSAEFKDVRVEKAGTVLYASDFSKGTEDWQGEQRRGGGQWSVQEGAFRQAQNTRGSRYFGSNDWSDYTLTLKARKLGGGEGFLIMFGRKGEEMYWWNLGGWGNSQHAVEFSSQGNQTPVGRGVPGNIETGRWYDIKIEVSGRNIRCHLDGKLIHDVTTEPQQNVFAVAGRSADGNELVVKMINLAPESYTADLKLGDLKQFAPEAELSILTSNKPTDNNSLDAPQAVVPKSGKLRIQSPALHQELPPHSLTILRLKKQ